MSRRTLCPIFQRDICRHYLNVEIKKYIFVQIVFQASKMNVYDEEIRNIDDESL